MSADTACTLVWVFVGWAAINVAGLLLAIRWGYRRARDDFEDSQR